MRYLVFLIMALPACAQSQPATAMPESLKSYLDIDDAQEQRLTGIRAVYLDAKKSAAKKMEEVRNRIDDEMKKDHLDSSKIGDLIRELLERYNDFTDLDKRIPQETQAVLTPDQKERLKGLHQAALVEKAMWEARDWGILPNPGYAPSQKGAFSDFLAGVNAEIYQANKK